MTTLTTFRCGHPATQANTNPNGYCRTCRNAREQRYRRRVAAGLVQHRAADLYGDRTYREAMEASNRAFVAALLAALSVGAEG